MTYPCSRWTPPRSWQRDVVASWRTRAFRRCGAWIGIAPRAPVRKKCGQTFRRRFGRPKARARAISAPVRPGAPRSPAPARPSPPADHRDAGARRPRGGDIAGRAIAAIVGTRAIGPRPNAGRPAGRTDRGDLESRPSTHPPSGSAAASGEPRTAPAYTGPPAGRRPGASRRAIPARAHPCDDTPRCRPVATDAPRTSVPAPRARAAPRRSESASRLPDAYRLKQARGLDRRRRGLPMPARLLLVVAVVALGGAVFATATGGIGSLVRALGTSLSGFVDDISATPAPSSTPTIVADAPVIASPTEPYTNQPRADLEVTIPDEYVGDPAVRVRIYLALEGQAPAPIAETTVGSTIRLIVPVDLTPGRNDLSATIVEAGIESEASPIVTFILDTEPPQFILSEPEDGATVNRPDVAIVGTTQPRTTLLARNEANGTSISGQAGADGTFTLDLPLEPGPNGIRLRGTDPAGNEGELALLGRPRERRPDGDADLVGQPDLDRHPAGLPPAQRPRHEPGRPRRSRGRRSPST